MTLRNGLCKREVKAEVEHKEVQTDSEHKGIQTDSERASAEENELSGTRDQGVQSQCTYRRDVNPMRFAIVPEYAR
eukprot:4199933-Amphidinium_carterae.1